jgi:hypothetical protein
MPDESNSILGLVADIVSAHVSHNSMSPDQLPKLISDVHQALATVGQEIGLRRSSRVPRLRQAVQDAPAPLGHRPRYDAGSVSAEMDAPRLLPHRRAGLRQGAIRAGEEDRARSEGRGIGTEEGQEGWKEIGLGRRLPLSRFYIFLDHRGQFPSQRTGNFKAVRSALLDVVELGNQIRVEFIGQVIDRGG